jgi:hypothetical protein
MIRFNLKCKALVVVAVAAIAMVFTSIASAHSSTLTVSAVCNTETGKYDISWTVNPTNLNLSPKIFASDRSAIPVGAAVPAVFTESIAGNSNSVSASITVRWSDNFKSYPTASTELAGNCRPPVTPPVTPPTPPRPPDRQGFCDTATGEYLDLLVGQDKVPPYDSRNLVPAVDGACPQVNVPPTAPPVVKPPVTVPPKAKPPVKKPHPKPKPKKHPKPLPKPKPPVTKVPPFTG